MQWQCYKRVFRDTWIRSLKADTNLLISDTQIPGLHLRYYAGTRKVAFYLGYMVKNTRRRRNLFLGHYGEFRLDEIRARAISYRQKVSDGQDPVIELAIEQKKREEEHAKRIKIKDLLDVFLEKYSKVYKKATSIRSDEGLINRIKPYLGELYITDLDLPTLTDFYKQMSEKSSFATANHYIALLSTFWNWCETYKYLPLNSNPCGKIKRGKDKKKPVKPLTPDEYKRLFDAIEAGLIEQPYNPSAFRALKILMLTGNRETEITLLNKTDVDFNESFIYLRDSKNNEEKHPIGKPALDELRKAIEEAPKDSERIFPAKRGKPGAAMDLRKALEWALERAGLPKMRKHNFRHSFISMGTDNLGLPIEVVSKAIGHADITTTAIYSHISDRTRLETANKIAVAIAG